LLGDSGTGKSHLLIALGTEAAIAGYRVRHALATKLVNELVEAADDKILTKTIARYGRVDLLCIDLCRDRNYAEGGPDLAGLAVETQFGCRDSSGVVSETIEEREGLVGGPVASGFRGQGRGQSKGSFFGGHVGVDVGVGGADVGVAEPQR
jgi:hypothetical protein